MYQRTHSSMISASNTRLRYIGSRAMGFVIQHLGQTKSGSLSDVPGCTRTPTGRWDRSPSRITKSHGSSNAWRIGLMPEALGSPESPVTRLGSAPRLRRTRVKFLPGEGGPARLTRLPGRGRAHDEA